MNLKSRRFRLLAAALAILVLLVAGLYLLSWITASRAPTGSVWDLEALRMPACTDEPEAFVCELRREWDTEAVLARLEAEGAPVWLDDGALTFVYQGAADAVFLNGGIQSMMNRLADDLWSLTVRGEDLSAAALSYDFIPLHDHVPAFSDQAPATWRGPDAPPEPPHSDPLRGTLEEHEFASTNLGASRSVAVYLPPGHDPALPLPVLYMADGQMLADFAPYLDASVAAGTLPPLLVVGIYAATTSTAPGDDPRAAEYLPHLGDARFFAHEAFLLDEVLPWAEATFGAAATREQRAIFGVSNGAAFAIAMGLRHPDRFASVIAFSVAGDQPAGRIVENAPPVRWALLAGTLEPFHVRTGEWADYLTAAGQAVEVQSRVGGHDSLLWREALPAMLAPVPAGE